MIRRPPRSTRTDTLFPYTTRVRSRVPAFAGMTNKSDLASAAKDRFACASTSIRRTPMSSTHDPASLDQRCIDTLRFLSVDMVQKADSGHPGLPLGAAPMAYVLWQRFLTHTHANPLWTDRDRFVLPAGPGSALQSSLLHAPGHSLTSE